MELSGLGEGVDCLFSLAMGCSVLRASTHTYREMGHYGFEWIGVVGGRLRLRCQQTVD